jgi:hypothetical protein
MAFSDLVRIPPLVKERTTVVADGFWLGGEGSRRAKKEGRPGVRHSRPHAGLVP